VQLKSLLRSATFRLALIYVLLFSVSVLGLLGFIYWSTAGYMSRQTDATIRAEIQGLAERYETDGLAGLIGQIGDRLRRQSPGESSLYLLTNSRLEPQIGNLNAWPAATPDPDGWVDFHLGNDRAGRSHRARAQVFRLRGGRFHLLVGRDMYELQAAQRVIVNTLVWGLLLTLALALAGGAMLSRGFMARIEGINKAVVDIMAGNLKRRIVGSGGGDELDQLASHLNAMLDQIELLMDGVRRVSDNIAHDLKTPMARLRNRLEALNKPAIPEADRLRLTEEAVNEADGLLATFNALLRIARIEASARREAFRVVDLSALARDVIELYEPVAESRKQLLALSAEEPVSVHGDRDLLFQALANLVDNAIKYTPELETIRLEVRPGSLNICDRGPGIAEAEREKVFQRFYRGDASRTTPGSGLGLALVQAVVSLHDMSIELGDHQPGLCVRLKWPRAAA